MLSNAYSTKLKAFLHVGSEYNYKELAYLIDAAPGYFTQSGVVTKKDEDFLILLINLKKRSDATQYKDKIYNSTLIWEGQTNRKYAERYIEEGAHSIFIFARERVEMDYTYYGCAVPIRKRENPAGTPSTVVFDLPEYAQYLENRAPANLYDGEEVADSSDMWDAPARGTVASAIVNVRTAQNKFRHDALALWNNKCAVSGVTEPKVLVASHIKPWRESTNPERVDPHNALVLSPNYDKLFDLGFITFKPTNGKIVLSDKIKPSDWDRLCIDDSKELRMVPRTTDKYLEYHNQCIFNYTPEALTIESLLIV